MVAPAVGVVELGRVGGPRPACGGPDRPGQLTHLARIDAVVLVLHRRGEGWWCAVLAARRPGTEGYLAVPDAEVAAGSPRLPADPGDPDGYAMAWRVRVCQLVPGGHAQTLARLLAEHVRRPASLSLELSPTALRLLRDGAHLRPPALRRLLDRLAATGLLTPTPTPAGAGRDGGWGTYTITMPATPDAAEATR